MDGVTRPAGPAVVGEDGVFEGYASLFGLPDLGGDVILPGAFAGSLARRPAHEVRMLFQHDPAEPIGTWLAIREDGRGLRVRGRLAREVRRARELAGLVSAGGVNGLSIGFRTVIARRRKGQAARELVTLDLWEISIVTFPLHPGARIVPGRPDAAATDIARRMRMTARQLHQQRQ